MKDLGCVCTPETCLCSGDWASNQGLAWNNETKLYQQSTPQKPSHSPQDATEAPGGGDTPPRGMWDFYTGDLDAWLNGGDGGPDIHPSSQRFHDILRELAALHDAKQKDYGRTDDPFSNVRASEEWGVDGWVGALVRATDKVRRLQAFVQNGSLANEGVEDSLRDLAVYAVIALVLWEESRT